ncbi:MAG: hypothetical protein ACYCYL_01300 [Acidithiobacillus sp.]
MSKIAIMHCDASIGDALIYLIRFAKLAPLKFLGVILPILAVILGILLLTAFIMGKLVWNPIKNHAGVYQEARSNMRTKKGRH